jgi:hypothetical protein
MIFTDLSECATDSSVHKAKCKGTFYRGLINHDTMNMDGEMEIKLHTFLDLN